MSKKTYGTHLDRMQISEHGHNISVGAGLA
jgi:hypothetical protein